MYYPEIKVVPSLLSADYSKLGDEIKEVEEAGVDLLHIDIMDGHFVPNITIGPAVVKAIRKITNLKLDLHLMISNPDKFIPFFIDAGADIITFHIELYIKGDSIDMKSLNRTINKLKGKRFGLVLNPATPLKYLRKALDKFPLDFILLMSVKPGFGGQQFIPEVLDKALALREIYNYRGDLEIDGGIKYLTAKHALKAGCNILVAGSYIFDSRDRRGQIVKLQSLIKKYG